MLFYKGALSHLLVLSMSACVNGFNKINRHMHCLPYLIEKKIYNSNVTIQMISTLFVSVFMCIHKSCYIYETDVLCIEITAQQTRAYY